MRADPFKICDEQAHAIVYDPERAEIVCSKCGLVLVEKTFNLSMKNDVQPENNSLNRRSKEHLNRKPNFRLVEAALKELTLRMNIQETVQMKLDELCRIIFKKRMVRNYSALTLAQTLLYTAHKMSKMPITLTECAVTSAKDMQSVLRCYKKICKSLKLYMPRLEIYDYLHHLAWKLKVCKESLTLADKILSESKKSRYLRGSNPWGITAAALYISCRHTGHRITQREFARIAGVSEVTIRANCKILCNLLQKNLNLENKSLSISE